ncbi:Diphthamide biosynthesis protein 2 [Diatrype stigma]|uniref:2-(3-amino-3-carboxypropyl)histidine synthase subunit 2 n=1 Tax=Diatrype stigma TaxID=117547 RepID=A0AAN9UTS4_9PEZI
MTTTASELSAPPTLSTPAEHTFFEDPTPASKIQKDRPHRTDDELSEVYEVARTAAYIINQKWRRVALQFPDAMLPDAPWVVDALSRALETELSSLSTAEKFLEEERLQNNGSKLQNEKEKESGHVEQEGREVDMTARGLNGHSNNEMTAGADPIVPRLYILADTSYSACCVDEIAAEHADAEGVVHYGRACLSPTSRLPVLHIFTRQKLNYDAVAQAFETEFPQHNEKVVIMADVMFQEHVAAFCDLLREKGYTDVVATEIVRDPGGTIPNRKVVLPKSTAGYGNADDNTLADLKEHHLFHISTPPTSLLLTLSSRLSSLRIYPTPSSPYTIASDDILDPSTTPSLLRRRYGLVIQLATASIIGILVNTLSVRNYMDTIGALKAQIAAAGKKSYTIVVGKLNAAKLANFAEIDGWVVVGCWESGLVENQEELWKPVITPFELRLALQGEETRIWTGEWWGGIEGVGAEDDTEKQQGDGVETEEGESGDGKQSADPTSDETPEYIEVEGGISDEESEPPEFDLRTGKLVSHSRPMRAAMRSGNGTNGAGRQAGAADPTSSATPRSSFASSLVKRAKAGELATVNGVVSPGAEYLRSQRTWQGLGSDFNIVEDQESTVVEEGRSGVARGYTVGENAEQDRT